MGQRQATLVRAAGGSAAGQGLDLPEPGPHCIRRPRLEQRLDEAIRRTVVLVAAPAGFGKTTALAQWARTLPPSRAVVWLTLESWHDDQGRLANDLARLLGSTAPGLVLVLDQVEAIGTPESQRLLADVLTHAPEGTCTVLATRRRPPLSTGRLRAAERIDEIGPAELRFDEAEAAALLRRLDGDGVDPALVHALTLHTGGWPAALSLNARAVLDGSSPPASDHPLHPDVADYVMTELLEAYDPETRRLLGLLAIAGESDEDVDALGLVPEARARFDDLRRADPVLEDVDAGRGRYRLDPVVGTLARTLLERTDPDAAGRARERLLTRCLGRGSHERALRHALASPGTALLRSYLPSLWAAQAPGSPLVGDALARLGDDVVASDPELALVAAWQAGSDADGMRVRHWLGHCAGHEERAAATFRTSESGIALCHAVFGLGGVEETREAALTAMRREREHSARWFALAATALAWSEVVAGAPREALRVLAESAGTALPPDDPWAPLIRARRSAVQAIAQAESGLLDDALDAARESVAAADPAGGGADTEAWSLRAEGGVALHSQHLAEALPTLERALDARRMHPGQVAGWPLTELLLTIAPVRWLEGEREPAVAALLEASARLVDTTGPPSLADQADALRRQFSAWAVAAAGAGMTAREVEVLRLVREGRTRAQIAERLHLSPNTVKSHTRSAYRKLGASNRDEALARGRALGLV